MAAEIDPSFLGEQMKRLQSDLRQVKSDMAQMRADNMKVDGDIAALNANTVRLEMKLEAFRESVDDRFDQHLEIMNRASSPCPMRSRR